MLAPPQETRFCGNCAPSDAALLQLCRQGCEWAATAIHNRYEKRVRRLAQLHWPPSMRSRFDPDDIVQEVFERFFRALRRGLYTTSEESGLWGFFLVVTLNQIRKSASRHLSRRRDVRQTLGQGSLCPSREAEFPRQMSIAHSRLVVEELLETLSPIMRDVVEQKLPGCTVQEIARTLLISHRAVERLLQAIRQRFAGVFERSADPAPEAPFRLRGPARKPATRRVNGEPTAGVRRIRIA
jgi:RNA polymerase sigma factor (sigma-70 family)